MNSVSAVNEGKDERRDEKVPGGEVHIGVCVVYESARLQMCLTEWRRW